MRKKSNFVLKLTAIIVLQAFFITQTGFAAIIRQNDSASYGKNLRQMEIPEQDKNPANASGNTITNQIRLALNTVSAMVAGATGQAANSIGITDVDLLTGEQRPITNSSLPNSNLTIETAAEILSAYLTRHSRTDTAAIPDNFNDIVMDMLTFARRSSVIRNNGVSINALPDKKQIQAALSSLETYAPQLTSPNCPTEVIDNIFSNSEFNLPEAAQSENFNRGELIAAMATVIDIIATGTIKYTNIENQDGAQIQILRNSLFATIAAIQSLENYYISMHKLLRQEQKNWNGIRMTQDDFQQALKNGNTVLAVLGENHLVLVENYDGQTVTYTDVVTQELNGKIRQVQHIHHTPRVEFFEKWAGKSDGTKSPALMAVTDWQPNSSSQILTIKELKQINVGCGIMSFYGNSPGIVRVLEGAMVLSYRAPDSTGLGQAVGPDGNIILRRSLGKPDALAGLLYTMPFNVNPSNMPEEEITRAREELQQQENLSTLHYNSHTIASLYNNPDAAIAPGDYGSYHATSRYPLDQNMGIVKKIMSDYDMSMELVKYFIIKAFSVELEKKIPGNDKAKQRKIRLDEFKTVLDKKLAGDLTKTEDLDAWQRAWEILNGAELEIPSDFDKDIVRYAFRLLSANLVSEFNVRPELREEVQKIFNLKTIGTEIAGRDWYEIWQREYQLNMAGLALETLLRWFQTKVILPRQQRYIPLIGHLDGMTAGLLPVVINGHGRWGMCGGITVNNAHPHPGPGYHRILELNGSLRMDIYARLRDQQNGYFQQHLKEAEKEIIHRQNAEWAADEFFDGKTPSAEERAGFINDYIETHKTELHRSENDTEVLVYEWAMLFDMITSPEFVDFEPSMRAHLEELKAKGITDPDELALRLALIRTQEGSEMGVDTFSQYNPRVKYVASHNRPVAIIEHNGQIMVSSDQNAALALWSPKEIQDALREIQNIKDERKEKLKELRQRLDDKTISSDQYERDKNIIDETARQKEAAVLVNFKSDIIYLEGEKKFAKISRTTKDGKVINMIRVSDFEGNRIKAVRKSVTINPAQVGKGDDPTFLLHHIHEIPEILEKDSSDYISNDGRISLDSISDPVTGNILKPGLNINTLKEKYGDKLEKLERVFLIGVGSSWRDAAAAQKTFEAMLPGVKVFIYDPVELLNQGIEIKPTDLGVAITWSGTTASLIKAIDYMQQKGAMCCTVTGKIQSDLARKTADDGGSIDVQSGPEISVCTVKGYESILYMLNLLAVQLHQMTNTAASTDTNKIASHIAIQLKDDAPEIARVEMESEAHQAIIESVAKKYANRNKVLVIGSDPVIHEAELKFEEVLWIEGAAYDLSDKSFWPVINFPRLNPENRPMMLVNATDESRLAEAMEVIKRLKEAGADVVVQTYVGDHVDQLKAMGVEDIYITTKISSFLQSLVDAPFFFRLVHEMAVEKGMSPKDIDNCRNLAKSVTVTGAEEAEAIKAQASTMKGVDLDEWLATATQSESKSRATGEILQQAISLITDDQNMALNGLKIENIISKFGDKLDKLQDVIIVADDGASYNAGLAITNVFRELLGIDVTVIKSHDDVIFSIRNKENTLVITVSQSMQENQESATLSDIAGKLNEEGIFFISLSPKDSASYQASTESGGNIQMIDAKDEFNKYPLAMLNMMALCLKLTQLKTDKDIASYIKGMKILPAIVEQASDTFDNSTAIKNSMQFARLYDKVHVIGGGFAYADAHELSRLLRLNGIFAEPQLNDSAWHGPLAAVSPNPNKFADHANRKGVNLDFATGDDILVIMLATDSRFYNSALLDSQVYNTRNGRIILVTKDKYVGLQGVNEVGASEIIGVPEVPNAFTPFINAVFAQRFVLEYANAIRERFIRQALTSDMANQVLLKSALATWLEDERYRDSILEVLKQIISEGKSIQTIQNLLPFGTTLNYPANIPKISNDADTAIAQASGEEIASMLRDLREADRNRMLELVDNYANLISRRVPIDYFTTVVGNYKKLGKNYDLYIEAKNLIISYWLNSKNRVNRFDTIKLERIIGNLIEITLNNTAILRGMNADTDDDATTAPVPATITAVDPKIASFWTITSKPEYAFPSGALRAVDTTARDQINRLILNVMASTLATIKGNTTDAKPAVVNIKSYLRGRLEQEEESLLPLTDQERDLLNYISRLLTDSEIDPEDRPVIMTRILDYINNLTISRKAEEQPKIIVAAATGTVKDAMKYIITRSNLQSGITYVNLGSQVNTGEPEFGIMPIGREMSDWNPKNEIKEKLENIAKRSAENKLHFELRGSDIFVTPCVSVLVITDNLANIKQDIAPILDDPNSRIVHIEYREITDGNTSEITALLEQGKLYDKVIVHVTSEIRSSILQALEVLGLVPADLTNYRGKKLREELENSV